MVWNHFENLQDGPKGKVQDVLCKMPLATKVINRKNSLFLGETLKAVKQRRSHQSGYRQSLLSCPLTKSILLILS